MPGELDVVKAIVAALPGIQRTRGPHSISLMSHARAGGARAAAVVEYLKSIEGANGTPPNQPLTDADVAKPIGTCTFGVTPIDRVGITAISHTYYDDPDWNRILASYAELPAARRSCSPVPRSRACGTSPI